MRKIYEREGDEMGRREGPSEGRERSDADSHLSNGGRKRSFDPKEGPLLRDSVVPSHLYFEVFCYATEDLEKVRRSVLNIMPRDLRRSVDFDLSELKGYHGDPIIVMRGEVREGRLVRTFLENISKYMSPSDKFLLSEKFMEHLDERGNLYLRISKQDAFLERLKMGEKDVIKVKVSFQAYGKGKLDRILNYCKKLGLIF